MKYSILLLLIFTRIFNIIYCWYCKTKPRSIGNIFETVSYGMFHILKLLRGNNFNLLSFCKKMKEFPKIENYYDITALLQRIHCKYLILFRGAVRVSDCFHFISGILGALDRNLHARLFVRRPCPIHCNRCVLYTCTGTQNILLQIERCHKIIRDVIVRDKTRSTKIIFV